VLRPVAGRGGRPAVLGSHALVALDLTVAFDVSGRPAFLARRRHRDRLNWMWHSSPPAQLARKERAARPRRPARPSSQGFRRPPRRDNERAWLYRIATNKAIDGSRRRRTTVSLEDLRLAAPDRDGVTLVDLASAIRELPAGQRSAFVLRAVEGRPYREIAHAL